MRSPADHKMTRRQLSGFNNLAKTLSLNLYAVSYVAPGAGLRRYLEQIETEYHSSRLTAMLERVAAIIGARILNVAGADYEPAGASAALLISEEAEAGTAGGKTPESVLAHLNKSHLAVHTYPETRPAAGICTFRADLDAGTCGMISPLKALNFLLSGFRADVVVMDYRVRGFTRDTAGNKLFIDYAINSIQDFIAEETRDRYQRQDVNVHQENLFHTRMRLKQPDLAQCLFKADQQGLSGREQREMEKEIETEIAEIFNGGRGARGH